MLLDSNFNRNFLLSLVVLLFLVVSPLRTQCVINGIETCNVLDYALTDNDHLSFYFDTTNNYLLRSGLSTPTNTPPPVGQFGSDSALDFGKLIFVQINAEDINLPTFLGLLNAASTVDEISISFWLQLSAEILQTDPEPVSRVFEIHPGGNQFENFQNVFSIGYKPSFGFTEGPTIFWDTDIDALQYKTQSPPGRVNANLSTATIPGFSSAWWTQWHQYTLTKKGPVKSIYLDGVLMASINTAPPLGGNIQYFYLGCSPCIPTCGTAKQLTQTIVGGLNDFAIYSRQLTIANAVELTSGPKLPSTLGQPLIAYWNFDSSGTNYTIIKNLGGCVNCMKMPGWKCRQDIIAQEFCFPVCGDAYVTGYETCDVGQTFAEGTGCSPLCQIEPGYSCVSVSSTPDPSAQYRSPTRSQCSPICGDGMVVGTEICDTGINSSLIGTSSYADAIGGYTFTGSFVVQRQGHSPRQNDYGVHAFGSIFTVANSGSNVAFYNGLTSLLQADNYSLSFWVKHLEKHVPVETNRIFHFVPTLNDFSFSLKELRFGVNPINMVYHATSECHITDLINNKYYDDRFYRDKFRHIVITKNSESVTLYVEGEIAGGEYTGRCSNPPVPGILEFELLGQTTIIDDFAIFTRALVPFEVTQLFSGVSPLNISDPSNNAVPLLAYWDFNNVPPPTSACIQCESIQNGYTCPTPAKKASVCQTECGDGVTAGAETCDDGISVHLIPTGCSDQCQNQSGWSCNINSTTYLTYCNPVCGDGLIIGDELCDDGNLKDGDGCSSTCSVEPGYNCIKSPSNCTPVCGDGLVIGAERCDDNGLATKSEVLGCNARTCQVTNGWNCTYNSSTSQSDCTPFCGDGITLGNEQCDDADSTEMGCTNCTVDPGYSCFFESSLGRSVCQECYGPWRDTIFPHEDPAFPQDSWGDVLDSLGFPRSCNPQNECYHELTINISNARCSHCDLGIIVENRIKAAATFCTEATTRFSPCSFSCRNLSTTFASESMKALKRELDKGWITELINTRFGINATFTFSKKRQSGGGSSLSYTMDPCNSTNIPNATNVINVMIAAIVPNAPALTFSNSGCQGQVASSDAPPFPIGGVVGGVVGGVFLFLVILAVIIILIYMYRKPKSDLPLLPKEVRASYEEQEREGDWDFQGSEIKGKKQGYYFKLLRKLKSGEDENDLTNAQWKDGYQKLVDLLTNCCRLEESGYQINQITQVYNKDLVTSFINNWRTQCTRIENSPGMFASEKWKTANDTDDHFKKLQTAVCDFFDKNTKGDKYPWNNDEYIKDKKYNELMLTVHGTDLPIAQQICQTGFANLSSLDAGFYGRGIYFSSFLDYIFLYVSTRKHPAVLVSWVATGHFYPVVESHTGPNNLLGAAIKAGYTSHYVRCNPLGYPSDSVDDNGGNVFDEIVIQQESQISPAFILHLSRKNFRTVTDRWCSVCDSVSTTRTAQDTVVPRTKGDLGPRAIPGAGLDGDVLSSVVVVEDTNINPRDVGRQVGQQNI